MSRTKKIPERNQNYEINKIREQITNLTNVINNFASGLHYDTIATPSQTTISTPFHCNTHSQVFVNGSLLTYLVDWTLVSNQPVKNIPFIGGELISVYK